MGLHELVNKLGEVIDRFSTYPDTTNKIDRIDADKIIREWLERKAKKLGYYIQTERVREDLGLTDKSLGGAMEDYSIAKCIGISSEHIEGFISLAKQHYKDHREELDE